MNEKRIKFFLLAYVFVFHSSVKAVIIKWHVLFLTGPHVWVGVRVHGRMCESVRACDFSSPYSKWRYRFTASV